MKLKFILLFFVSLLIIFFSLFFFIDSSKKTKTLVNPDSLLKPAANIQSQQSSPSPLAVPNLSLEAIFSQHQDWLKSLPINQTITIITTGDVIPARSVNFKMIDYNNFNYPFENTAEFLQSADIAFINLEAPLIKNCPVTQTGMIFCGHQNFINGLKFSQIDVVNLANNHILNHGVNGAEQTISLLKKAHIKATGYPQGDLSIVKVKDFNIGFLGWNLLDQFNQKQIINIIKKASVKVDILLVSYHWGQEYVNNPADWQINLAHQSIEAGADLIVGNHPHWIQPLEIYQQKLIIYSHGNFIFDQEWSQATKTGILLKHTFYNKKLVDSQIVPIYIKDFSQPEILTGERQQQVLNQLQNLSIQIKQKGSTLIKNQN
jgi:gamma-polyglutamate biosynthesis protein CapA